MENRRDIMPIQEYIKRLLRKKINSDYAIQRESGQWDKKQMSLLIDSIIRGYLIPDLYIVKEGTEMFSPMALLDGCQRCDTIFRFYNDEFKLSADLDDVVIVDVSYDENSEIIKTEKTYKIAGKKYSQLDPEIQETFLQYKLGVVLLADYTDDELEDLFYRLNNGSAFTTPQKANAVLGMELADKFAAITNNNLFAHKASFTKRQGKTGEKLSCVLQSMMLLTGFECKNYSNNEVLRYATCLNEEYTNGNFSVKQIDYCNYLVNKLYALLQGVENTDNSIKKVHIPTLIMNVEKMEQLEQDGEITQEQYKEFLSYWFSEGIKSDEYVATCGAGSVGKVKTEDRINVMEKALLDFIDTRFKHTEAADNTENDIDYDESEDIALGLIDPDDVKENNIIENIISDDGANTYKESENDSLNIDDMFETEVVPPEPTEDDIKPIDYSYLEGGNYDEGYEENI